MSGPFGSSQWMYSSGAASFYDHQIDGSLRFNKPDSSYLTRTPASDGTRTNWTWSAWVKLGVLPSSSSNDIMLFNSGSGSAETTCYINGINGRIEFYHYSGSFSFILKTNNLLRDPSAWYHLVITYDSSNSTSSERQRIYINGERVTSFDTENYSSQNFNTFINSNTQHWIGTWQNLSAMFAGYMAEINFVDGSSLTPTSFGETKSGVWIPKEYSGSYGTNGYHLEFAGNANDSSGNGNNWTANNITSDDYVSDSPTDNFATLNSVSIYGGTLSDGNLRHTSGGQWVGAPSTIAMSSGKWYCEFTATDANNIMVGVVTTNGSNVALLGTSNQGYPGKTSDGYGWINNANKINNDVSTSYGSSPSNGDIIMIAFDADNGELYTGKNGTWFNSSDPATNTSPMFSSIPMTSDYYFVASTENANGLMNFGQLGFTYTPPTGYLALSTANLTVAEAVDPAEDNSPVDYFSTVLYSGTDGVAGSVTGVGFQPDFVWVKSRANNGNHTLADSVRGVQKSVYANVSNSEVDNNTGLLSFDSDGFSYGTSGDWSDSTHVAWNWKANGSGSSNTDGSITSTVSASTGSGFSIVGWTGDGASRTIGHGLDEKPEFIALKNRSDSDKWEVMYDNTNPTNSMILNENGAGRLSNYFSSVSTTTFGVGPYNRSNGSGDGMIAYCFHSVEGFSNFSSYVGNGSSDGVFVYTGFRPSFLIIKATGLTEGWIMYDTKRNSYNLSSAVITAEEASAEATNVVYGIDILSNGFKGRYNWNGVNGSGQNYIYMAFAENPFKYANAR